MEINEAIHETNDSKALHTLLLENQGKEGILIKEIHKAFENGDMLMAKRLSMQLTYLERIHETILEKL